MPDDKEQYGHLQHKLADLQKRQDQFQTEILLIKQELARLTAKGTIADPAPESHAADTSVSEKPVSAGEEGAGTAQGQIIPGGEARPAPVGNGSRNDLKIKADLERFIGENLINKIGIAITVIGVGIGARYAIDHRLISPLARIVLGYIVGLGLFFLAERLKSKYESYSSVLVSGSMAILYFITYAAYSIYGFYPQLLTFILMVLFTSCTVYFALRYNREIIAVIGMVGAFAVPYLLREGSDNVLVFFSYIAIINTGIMIIALKRYWKSLYLSAFIFTWLIYLTWISARYSQESDFGLAFSFLFIFFIVFYVTFLSYKLISRDKFRIFDILLLLFNSFIFYGAGSYILHSHQPGESLRGLFTLMNAIIQLIISAVVYRNKLADRNMFYFVSGLAVVFLTIAVPVELNGNWVTLLWICEALLLFGIGRIKKAPVYENLSYILILIAFLSLSDDWSRMLVRAGSESSSMDYTPVFNIQFFSSLIFIAAFAGIIAIYFNRRYPSPHSGKKSVAELLSYGLPALFILVVYLTFRNEISAYYNHLIRNQGGGATDWFKKIWLCNYSLFFLAILSIVNVWRIRNKFMGIAVFWLSLLAIAFFLLQSLFILSNLRESFLGMEPSGQPDAEMYKIVIRYLSLPFVAASLLSLRLWVVRLNDDNNYSIIFSLLFHLTALWILCSEMLNIMDLLRSTHSYKFGLSILTGVYALLLIVLGIVGKKRYLRVAAIALLGLTLAKLFFYDITRLDTILKTILFLALGFLMLLVSFLYNKYRIRLYGEAGEGSKLPGN